MYSILDTIGNTPLVEIKKLNPNPNVRIFAKLEFFNPGASIKDRAALYMIEAAEKSGKLTKDKTIIEATSGNTGIGLAMIAAVKGYKFVAVMSEGVSEERKKILTALGAKIFFTPKELGTDGAIEEVYKLLLENKDKYFMPDQYNNDVNWQAHYYGTGVEIIEQTKDVGLDYFIAAIGTTGTLMGVSRRLKEHNPEIKIIGVEPYLGHKIQGLKNLKESYSPEIFDKTKLDSKINIEDEKAFEMTKKLAKEEGIFVGMSSGAAFAATLEYIKNIKKGTVVTIFPDSGDRYLSTSLFDSEKKTDIKVYNSIDREKVDFHPVKSDTVSIYSFCYTAYRRINLDDIRRFIFADFIASYFKYKNFDVKHLVTINDLDDKTIEQSRDTTAKEFVDKNIKDFFNDLKLLKIDTIDNFPYVTKEIEAMVNLAEKLYKKGYAYEKLKSLYFNISKIKDYGKLSGINLNKIKVGKTVDLDEYEKNNPRDFTLFKRATFSDLKEGASVKTIWGNVRPTLPIKCVATSTKYLGENFDIYVAPKSFIFPSNENEVAISNSAFQGMLAKYFLHLEKVIKDGKKISEKEFINLDEIKKEGFDTNVIRYWIISTHYRKTLNFSINSLKSAEYSLNKINRCIKKLSIIINDKTNLDTRKQILYDIKNGFNKAMEDDFNVSIVFANLFKQVKTINLALEQDSLGRDDAKEIIKEFKKIDRVLKLFNFEDEKKVIGEEIKDLIEKRDVARKEKDWVLADEIRDILLKKGFLVQDTKNFYT